MTDPLGVNDLSASSRLRLSAPPHKYGGIRTPLHPRARRATATTSVPSTVSEHSYFPNLVTIFGVRRPTCWAWRICSTASPRSYREASASGLPWAVLSCASPRRSSSTNRCPTSTPSSVFGTRRPQATASKAADHNDLRDARPDRGMTLGDGSQSCPRDGCSSSARPRMFATHPPTSSSRPSLAAPG